MVSISGPVNTKPAQIFLEGLSEEFVAVTDFLQGFQFAGFYVALKVLYAAVAGDAAYVVDVHAAKVH